MNSDAVQRVVWGMVGFIVGAGLGLALEILLIGAMGAASGHQMLPRGVGWATIPIAGGVGGAALGSRFRLQMLDRFFSGHRALKILASAVIGWLVLVIGFVVVADPFGGYWSNDDWSTFWRWLALPPVFVAPVAGLYFWVRRGHPKSGPPQEHAAPLTRAEKLRATIEPLIATSKLLGAATPREAFDMAIGRPSDDVEWERHREAWELLWPYVKAAGR